MAIARFAPKLGFKAAGPMKLLRPFANTGLAVLLCGTACAQTPAAGPRFEVASLKPAEVTPETLLSRFGMRINAARVDIGYVSVEDLIVAAYRVRPDQVSGPAWITDLRFNIVAKLPDSKDQAPAMLQALPAERFKLTLHHDQTPKPVYALVVAKNGPKLKESTGEDSAEPGCKMGGRRGEGHLTCHKVGMEDLVKDLSGAVQSGIDRPVVV
jgi:uncharacterized protein (TIGR03435 family)